MMELNYKIKLAVENIRFIERYENLSNIYNDKRTPLDEIFQISFQLFEDFKHTMITVQ